MERIKYIKQACVSPRKLKDLGLRTLLIIFNRNPGNTSTRQKRVDIICYQILFGVNMSTL